MFIEPVNALRNTHHIVHLRAQVLPLSKEAMTLIDLDLGVISGPPSLGLPARNREMGIFNPSLVAAPANLCRRCAYVAAVRVDPLHQCHEASPLLRPDPGMPKNTAANAWFKGTAIAVLDKDLKVLGWTWLINAPQHQLSNDPSPSRWFAPVGAADRFSPPWSKAVYDMRIVSINDHLFVSFVCRKCAFSIAQLQLTAEGTADGGLRALRAWQSRRFSTLTPWAQGRNQALFVASRREGGPNELMVQPWMQKVGSFGAPEFKSQRTVCRKGSVRICGATPPGTALNLDRVTNERSGGFGTFDLVGNSSHPALSRAQVGGYRLSTTSNLVRVSRGSDCAMHLGVGHLHRAEGELNLRMAMLDDDFASTPKGKRGGGRRRRKLAAAGGSNSSVPRQRTFMWGYQYTHFFYALEPHAPFRVFATSREFCMASEQNPADCESIQFASGLTLAPDASTLLLSYGINDCEAKVAKLPLSQVLGRLRPLDGVAAPRGCF